MRVTIFEDDENIVQLLTDMLELEDFDVSSTTHADDALDFVKGNIPDIIIIDYWLDDGTAKDVVSALKGTEFENVPKVLISAIDNIDEKKYELGVNTFVKKPFDLFELKSVIQSYINQQRNE